MQPQLPNPVFLNVEYFFFLIYRVLARFFNFLFGGNITDPNAGSRFFSGLKVFATIIVIILITIILYCLVRLYELEQEDKPKKESKILDENISGLPGATSEHFIDHGASRINETWNSVRSKLLSDNPSDWRLAIIEADIYLDRILDQKGFYGDTLGDKLKQITPDKLPSINIAWEAHKVRNRIAHDGADYILTMPESRRVLSYYEIVFRDLDVID